MSDTLTMTRGLLEDYKRQARNEERERILDLIVEEIDSCDCETPLQHLVERIEHDLVERLANDLFSR